MLIKKEDLYMAIKTDKGIVILDKETQIFMDENGNLNIDYPPLELQNYEKVNHKDIMVDGTKEFLKTILEILENVREKTSDKEAMAIHAKIQTTFKDIMKILDLESPSFCNNCGLPFPKIEMNYTCGGKSISYYNYMEQNTIEYMDNH